MLTFAEERFADVVGEIQPLLARHWEEIALYKDIPLLPDYQRYRRADALGVMPILTVRDGRRLVGYAIYVVDPNLHYSQTLTGVSDIFWLDPEMRKPRAAMRLFQEVESVLRSRSVDVMVTRTKIAHPAAGRILEALGHESTETTYQKRLRA